MFDVPTCIDLTDNRFTLPLSTGTMDVGEDVAEASARKRQEALGLSAAQ